jgi:hypothetical protein
MKTTSLIASIVLVPASAFAEMTPANQSRSTKIEIGLRGAYAVPFGKIDDALGDNLDQWIEGDLPLMIELNYRFVEQVLGGIYFSYGFGSNGDFVTQQCARGASCSGSTLRFGIGVYYHLMPQNQLDPWFGTSFGYEQFKLDVSGPGGSAYLTASGVEFFNAQAGLDFHLSPLFAIGPFVSAAVGRYIYIDAPGQSGVISNKAMHGWFNLGARISFTP